MVESRLVLGIDAGIGACGYALVRFTQGSRECLRAGIVETSPDREVPRRDDVVDRGRRIAAEILREVYSSACSNGGLDVLAVEDFAGAPNRNVMHACWFATGVVVGTIQASLRPKQTALLGPDEVKEVLGLGKRGQKMDKAWVPEMLRPYHGRVDGLLEDISPAKRNHAWDAIAAAEAVVFLRADWFDGLDPWAGIRREAAPVVTPESSAIAYTIGEAVRRVKSRARKRAA